MASNTTGSNADRLTHPLLEQLGSISAASEGLFAYSAKIVCGYHRASSAFVAKVDPGGTSLGSACRSRRNKTLAIPKIEYILPADQNPNHCCSGEKIRTRKAERRDVALSAKAKPNFFYSKRSQPIEKSRFQKINASKR